MINCENPLSTYQWFHMSCLRMKKVPKTWFCPRCHSIKKQTTKTDNLYSNYCMMYIVVFLPCSYCMYMCTHYNFIATNYQTYMFIVY